MAKDASDDVSEDAANELPNVVLTPAEIRLASEFSPLPPPPDDPTNAVYQDAAAARLGHRLFFDERLSGPGDVSCATCHVPALDWADSRRLAKAIQHHPRHTMSLWNVAYNRWFFWDGRADTLWSQATQPFEDPREHGTDRLHVIHTFAADEAYVAQYREIFGEIPDFADPARFPAHARPVPGVPDHELAVAWTKMREEDQLLATRVFVNLAKAIAAFERQIVSRRAPFDVFVEGLVESDADKLAAISTSAQRGFSLFVGKARCILCHDGPNFTDMEFHANRAPTGEGVDPGRALGVMRLKDDPLNSLSTFADDGGALGRIKLSLPRGNWHIPGDFKTPTLRNVTRTAPYMHEGQFATLREVIEFYSTLENAAPPGRHDEKILEAVHLTPLEIDDLLAFLDSLTDDQIAEELRRPPE